MKNTKMNEIEKFIELFFFLLNFHFFFFLIRKKCQCVKYIFYIYIYHDKLELPHNLGTRAFFPLTYLNK